MAASLPDDTASSSSSLVEDDDSNARSQFGTRQYWDDLYLGRGDFPADEYSWYFGWETLQTFVKEYIPDTSANILCPGIGNDPLLVDLYKAGYTDLTAFDYSEYAVERQEDSISYALRAKAKDTIQLYTMDARKLPSDWSHKFDAIIEKGALDAIYLSGDGNVERAVLELNRVLKPGGICMSVSGVVPGELRREMFQEWNWIRDGSDELKAGCFVFQKPKN
jgi:SAM-dependent methyltransferase